MELLAPTLERCPVNAEKRGAGSLLGTPYFTASTISSVRSNEYEMLGESHFGE
jgi:hypothetical protein